jgi:hypothetical protein
MIQTHIALISITLELTLGSQRLKEAVSTLEGIGQIIGVSSVYKRYLNYRMEDLNSELVVVLKMETEKTAEEIFRFLKGSQLQQIAPKAEACVLLAYDNQVRLLPGQNLPSPLLRSDGLTLRCAAEAWGSYEHPVLGQTLNELVRSNESLPQAEFFAQGRSLF